MATQCSFDVTSNVDLQEVDNALNQARKEVAQRYDFKGSKASIDFDQKESKLVLVADDEFKLNALWEIVSTRLVRRNVPVKNLTRGPAQPAANSTVRQEMALQQGIPTEKAKRHRQIHQGCEAEESSGRRSRAISCASALHPETICRKSMRLLREQDFGVALQFGNYRGGYRRPSLLRLLLFPRHFRLAVLARAPESRSQRDPCACAAAAPIVDEFLLRRPPQLEFHVVAAKNRFDVAAHAAGSAA